MLLSRGAEPFAVGCEHVPVCFEDLCDPATYCFQARGLDAALVRLAIGLKVRGKAMQAGGQLPEVRGIPEEAQQLHMEAGQRRGCTRQAGSKVPASLRCERPAAARGLRAPQAEPHRQPCEGLLYGVPPHVVRQGVARRQPPASLGRSVAASMHATPRASGVASQEAPRKPQALLQLPLANEALPSLERLGGLGHSTIPCSHDPVERALGSSQQLALPLLFRGCAGLVSAGRLVCATMPLLACAIAIIRHLTAAATL
mmetsp:Transcript_11521/g.35678  ORF Transcript_11521/g.35678 Transcript_11521/m.35678 type:complete len:257 (+) Transcript_11521:51-821(+)